MLRWFTYFLALASYSFSQTVLKAVLKDQTTLKPLAYASIGLVGKHVGTLSDEQGNFELSLPMLANVDTLRISAIGYESNSYVRSEIKSLENNILLLKPMSYDLTAVDVKPLKVHY